MKVLVTGGAGYVGSHACKALARAGHEPVVFDDLSRGHAYAVKWGPHILGDLLDEQALANLFRDHDFQAVLHFAAFSDVSESVNDPLKYYRNIIGGSINLLKAMIRARCDKLVFSSTCQVYGAPSQIPVFEDEPKRPVNPYGRCKAAVEQMLQDCADAHDLRSVSLRYFNAAGADPEGELGEEHDPESRLIPLVLQVAAGVREAVEVYGLDYPTEDGTAVRDYVHVTDVADAHVAALKHLEAHGDAMALNIGTGRGYSVNEIIEAARAVTGREIPTRSSPRRPGDLPELIASCERAASILSWRPSIVRLDEIIETAWNWQSRAR